MRKLFKCILFLITIIAGLVLWAKSPVTTKPQILNSEITAYPNTQTVPPKSSLRLITYNLGYAYAEKNNLGLLLTGDDVRKNLDTAVAKFRELQPDVICLQEIDFDARRTDHIDELDYLATHLGFSYAAYALNWNHRYLPWPYWPPSLQFGQIVSGQAILSRYPLTNQRLTVLDKPPNPFWYNWFYLDRLAERVDMHVGERTIALWNLHLEAFDKPTRLKQAAFVGKMVHDEPNANKIVCGDLNDPEASDPHPEQNASSTIAAAATLQADEEFAGKFTFPAWQPVEKLDHVLFSKQFTFEHSQTVPINTSDHMPVMVDLGLAQ